MITKSSFLLGAIAFFVGTMVVLPHVVNAQGGAGGANCTTDLVGEVPDGVDWRSIFIIRGPDGSAWQRAIVSNGARGEFLLREFEPTKIYGTAAPETDVQIYLFAPRQNPGGGILKPNGMGTCFMADEAWKSDPEKEDNIELGYFELPVSAKFLWPMIGEDMVFDAFFKLDQSWDSLMADQRYKGSQNFFIGTHISPKTLRVAGEWDEAVCDKICENGPALGVSLDPYKLHTKYLGDNFAGVNGQRVNIGRMPGVHTFYAGYQTAIPTVAERPALREITQKALSMEIIKRTLLAQSEFAGTAPGLPQISAQHLQSAAFGSLPVSEETRQLARYLAVLMIGNRGVNPIEGDINPPTLPEPPPQLPNQPQIDDVPALPDPPALPGDPSGIPGGGGTTGPTDPSTGPVPIQTERPPFVPGVPRPPVPPPPGINFLSGVTLLDSLAAIDELLNQGQNEGLLADVFPTGISNMETWSSDLVTLISFWTGSLRPNLCLLADDEHMDANFEEQEDQFTAFQCEEQLPYVTGKTPLLLLNTEAEMIVEPRFREAIITSAAATFDTGESWILPAGKKEAIDYHYAFTTPFDTNRLAEACIKPTQIGALVDSISKQLSLGARESTVLAKELHATLPTTVEFVKLRFADPQAIGQRLQWFGNGKRLDILPLFFERSANACSETQMPELSAYSKSEREGFEVGVLK